MQTTRVIVISDLHLGGAQPAMMSHPGELATFIGELPKQLRSDEALELVIAGDFIDFLSIPLDGHSDAWSGSSSRAVAKLDQAMQGQDLPVYRALGDFVKGGHRLTIIVGNHDLELTIPAVQQQFCANLGVSRHQLVFVDDGQAWRVGKALIEHGNRYDGANLNDWQCLRATASAWSRGENAPTALEISAGSQIVQHFVNPLKQRYPFIDILQPEGELLAYLLLAIEPTLKYDFKAMRRLLVGAISRAGARKDGAPRAERNVGHIADAEPLVGKPRDTRKLDELFGIEPLAASEREVGIVEWIGEFLRDPGDNLAKYLVYDQPVPRARLLQIQEVMSEMLKDDDSLNPAGATEQYGRNAERLLKQTDVEVVVMGHTHEARHVGAPTKATFINTGTWVDSISVPRSALETSDAGEAQLQRWLRDLYHDRNVRGFRPHWADLRIEANGTVSKAALCRPQG